MIETENKKYSYENLKSVKLDRIGIKLNNKMVKILSKRIREAESIGRGVNILIGGDISFFFDLIKSDKKGFEYKFNLTDTGDFNIFDWGKTKAYNGSHSFWLEGFVKKEKMEE